MNTIFRAPAIGAAMFARLEAAANICTFMKRNPMPAARMNMPADFAANPATTLIIPESQRMRLALCSVHTRQFSRTVWRRDLTARNPMNHIELNPRDPAIAHIVKATFPDYRKRKVYLRAAENVTLYDLNWSGGTRAEYRTCTLDGRGIGNTSAYSQLAPWNNYAEGKTLPIPQGFAVVRGGHFCGKAATLAIMVNPADMPKYIAKQ